MSRLTQNGESWETRNLDYGYYGGEPCKIVDLYGNFDTWASKDTVVLQARDLGRGWVRYWLTSDDDDLRVTDELAAAYSRHRWRFW